MSNSLKEKKKPKAIKWWLPFPILFVLGLLLAVLGVNTVFAADFTFWGWLAWGGWLVYAKLRGA